MVKKKPDKKYDYGQKLELRIEIVESRTSPSFVLWSYTLCCSSTAAQWEGPAEHKQQPKLLTGLQKPEFVVQ